MAVDKTLLQLTCAGRKTSLRPLSAKALRSFFEMVGVLTTEEVLENEALHGSPSTMEASMSPLLPMPLPKKKTLSTGEGEGELDRFVAIQCAGIPLNTCPAFSPKANGTSDRGCETTAPVDSTLGLCMAGGAGGFIMLSVEDTALCEGHTTVDPSVKH